MKRILLLVLAIVVAALPAAAEKVIVASYHTKQPAAAVYDAVVDAITHNKFTVRLADSNQLTVQAYRQGWGDGSELASVFITVKSREGESYLKVIFTKHPGFLGGGSPEKWSADFANELIKSIPDLTPETPQK